MKFLQFLKPETISGLRTSRRSRAWEDCTAGLKGRRETCSWRVVRAGGEAANTAGKERVAAPQLTWFRTVREESRMGIGCGS